MSEMGLTPIQARLLDYLEERLKMQKVGPSYEEMRVYLGLSSRSSVWRIVGCLAERGHIRRLDGRARSIELISHDRVPGSFICPHCGHIAGSARCRDAATALAKLLSHATELQARAA